MNELILKSSGFHIRRIHLTFFEINKINSIIAGLEKMLENNFKKALNFLLASYIVDV